MGMHDQTFFLGLKCSFQDFFWVAWFKKGFFWGIQNNLKIRASARVSQSVSKCKICNVNDSEVA